MDFLNLTDKTFVLFGLANKKSLACAIGKTLIAQGARVIHVVRSQARQETAGILFPGCPVFICDVEDEANIARVRDEIAAEINFKGLSHAIILPNLTVYVYRCTIYLIIWFCIK